jgi:dGTP triphosphohydrolase
MKGIKWNFFLPKPKLSADGSTTLDSLKAEKQRLEARLTQIPTTVANLQNSINLMTSDINWLDSLNNRRKKDWEKENGKSKEQAVYDARNRIVDYNAQISAMNTEKSRIPAQIEAIDRQLEALVKGESDGLSKGLTVAHAQQLGQLALQKEQETITHETQMQKVELEQAQATAQAEVEKAKGMNPQLKWGLIIGGSIIAIIIVVMVIRHKKASALKAVAS